MLDYLGIVVVVYLSSCHRTASVANDWMIRNFFVMISKLPLEKSASICLRFLIILFVSEDFFEFSSQNLLLVGNHQITPPYSVLSKNATT